MLLWWQKRGLQSTMLATASYTSKNGHISTISHQLCEAFLAKRVQDQIKWATASQINTIFEISREWCTSLAGMQKLCRTPAREVRHSRDIPKIALIQLAVAHFICSWSRLNTDLHPENAPQNHWRNGWLLVEICPFFFMSFCPLLTDCSGHYHASFCMILGSFKY